MPTRRYSLLSLVEWPLLTPIGNSRTHCSAPRSRYSPSHARAHHTSTHRASSTLCHRTRRTLLPSRTRAPPWQPPHTRTHHIASATLGPYCTHRYTHTHTTWATDTRKGQMTTGGRLCPQLGIQASGALQYWQAHAVSGQQHGIAPETGGARTPRRKPMPICPLQSVTALKYSSGRRRVT